MGEFDEDPGYAHPEWRNGKGPPEGALRMGEELKVELKVGEPPARHQAATAPGSPLIPAPKVKAPQAIIPMGAPDISHKNATEY